MQSFREFRALTQMFVCFCFSIYFSLKHENMRKNFRRTVYSFKEVEHLLDEERKVTIITNLDSVFYMMKRSGGQASYLMGIGKW